jgi:RNA polymerase sigma-70 factor (ECF subfamily)
MGRLPTHRLRAALLALSSGAFWTARAFAQEPAPAVVTYSASASCPPQAEFWRQVLVHLRGVPAKLRPINVEIVEAEDRALAHVTFEGDRGRSGKRELSGANCVEAVAAAALVVALEIDAQAQAAESPPPPAKLPDPVPRSKTAVPAPEPPVPPSEPRADGAPRLTAHDAALVWTIGAGAVAEHAVAPSPLLPALWRLLRRLGVSNADADDATQEVYLIVAERRTEILPGKERAFVYGTALRVAHSRLRRRDRSVELDEPSTAADDAPGIEDLLDQREARRLLDDLLQQMPFELRAVFVLFEMEELSTIDIAEALEIPRGTAASRLRRAREDFQTRVTRLRARLAHRGTKR